MRERSVAFAAIILAALSAVSAPARGQGTCNLPAPGAARSWEASIDVATYSSVNVRNGNLLTVVPVVGWSGVGPDVSFAFVHNSAHVDSGVDLDHTTGFNLGEGWQSSYSARLVFVSGSVTKVVHDDGTVDEYTLVTGDWVPPTGVYNTLEEDSGVWTLTFKDQSKYLFNSSGRLTSVEDAHGNALTLTRNGSDQLTKITDASGRKLLFDYNDNRLKRVIDLQAGGCWPAEDCDCECGVDCECEGGEEPEGSSLINRVWTLTYNGDDRLRKVIDPEEDAVEPEILITYDEDGRIESIEDKDGDAFEYTYHSASDALETVTDPDTLSTPYVQEFAYACSMLDLTSTTTYTDRRGHDWVYNWSASKTLTKLTNPLFDEQEFTFDGNKNLTVYKDGLDNTWTFTYDANGNLLKTFTPLMPNSGGDPTPKTERTYDSLNNLTSITDGQENTVTIDYDLGAYPTLPTKITLPADGEGNPALEIELSYYDDESDANGELFEVWMREIREEQDILLARFYYDEWGQVHLYGEGDKPELLPEPPFTVYHMLTAVGSDGRPTLSTTPSGSATHSTSPAWRNPTGSFCATVFGGDSPPDPPVLPDGFPDLPCETLGLPTGAGGWSADSQTGYTRMGQLLELEANVGVDGAEGTRTYTFDYDALGRGVSSEIASSDEGAAAFTREFTNDPEDADDGEVERTGPDGVTTTVVLDDAGRVASLTRSGMTATYDYDARGLVTEVTLGNGAVIEYEYDDDQRLIRVEHFDDSVDTILRLEYDYNDRDLPTMITESDEGGAFATVSFWYDDRGRLIAENRSVSSGPSPEYDLEYVYDQAGNRLYKIDHLAELQTHYVYDVDDVPEYGSDNNRLQYFTVWDTGGEVMVQVATTWYVYEGTDPAQNKDEGNPVRIVTEEAADPGVYAATRFVYDKAQRVWLMFGEAWEADGPDKDECPDNYEVTWAREFRYDAARARYLNRELDPAELEGGYLVALSEVWTDYDGDSAYGDWEFNANDPPTPDNLRSYEPGVALKDPWDESSGIEYYHTDLIGTTRAMTDSTGASASTVCYTAFGEKLEAGYHRYGYAGSWGYQTHDFPNGNEIPYFHVGWRYYDPGTGRFLQRDPIGIGGGLNVYEYADSEPSAAVDPLGLSPGKWDTRLGGGTGRVRLPNGRIGKTPWWRGPGAVGARLTAIGLCGWLAYELTDRVVVPAIKKNTRARRRAGNQRYGQPYNPNNPWGWAKGVPGWDKSPPPPIWLPGRICFLSGTMVLTPEGNRSIESIAPGDRVITANLELGESTVGVVSRVAYGTSKELIRVVLPNEVLVCTPEHPFWVKKRGWTKAGALQSNDELLSANGSLIEVVGVDHEYHPCSVRVFNITVDGCHVYYVGEGAVLVHNKQ
ncbi:MAG: hypothetical protein FLDDKLPJ_03573 [Phycisphaerae bacterium]|nr:hypothetical protein [Phycisphaerae bacterium]